jgi:Subtilase family
MMEHQKNHAKLFAHENNSRSLPWESKEKYRDRDRIGLWFNEHNLMKFKLINPYGDDKAPWVFQGEIIGYKFKTGDKLQMSYEADGRLLITITPESSNQVIETGKWKLEIVGISLKYPDDSIHAWIEYLEGRTKQRVIQFIDHIDEKITLTIPGTSKTVITVSSVNSSDSLDSSYFSSIGPTRDDRKQPITATVGENVSVAIAGTIHKIGSDSGTSFAAPKVTGVIALLLSARKKRCEEDPTLEQFNATDIKEILIAMTSDATSSWNPAIGYGVLDIEKLIANLHRLV